jgi:hypothetical protein
MPSMLHEALLTLFRNRPELAPELLRDVLGIELPAYTEARIDSAELTEIIPAEYRADLVILLVDGRPVLGIVVEVQLGKDPRKRFTWPVYAAGLRARLECDACVLVVTADDAVAAWAAEPIALGSGSVFKPLVVGPRGVPVVNSPELAHGVPELAVLSAMAHGRGDVDTAVQIALAVAGATEGLDPDRCALYSDLVMAALSEAARKALQMLPSGYEFQYEPYRRLQLQGQASRAESKAEAVLDVLDARGIAVADAQRERVLACTDLDTLRTWVRRAATVTGADELFVD